MRGARAVAAAWLLCVALPAAMAAAPRIDVYTREGCPHCVAAKQFLAQLSAREPELEWREHDVGRNRVAAAELEALCERAGVGVCGVPTFVVAGEIVVGFAGAETTGRRLEALLREPPPRASPNPATAPGGLSPERLGFPLFTVALGLVDGLNPCAMWALLFLLSMLVHVRSRIRMALIGGVFIAVGGLWYFALMAAWLNVFLWLGASRVVQALLGGVAIGLGALHLKEFLALGRGPSLAIPDSARPAIYARVRRVLRAENLPAALSAVALLAVLVNAVELLCTAGLPALYTETLARQSSSPLERYAYLALYNAAYVADDLAVLALAVATLGSHRLGERAGRWLQLLSGGVMIGLGAFLLLAVLRTTAA
jgi:glutaredoxin